MIINEYMVMACMSVRKNQERQNNVSGESIRFMTRRRRRRSRQP
jgi:hypothetical protein